jgi:hypothetical protein
MQSEEQSQEPVTLAWNEAVPCCANVWDDRIRAYRPCDEMADPDSDLDLCTTHHARLTSILSLINTAQTTARARESEEALLHQRDGRARICMPGPSRVGDRDGQTARS